MGKLGSLKGRVGDCHLPALVAPKGVCIHAPAGVMAKEASGVGSGGPLQGMDVVPQPLGPGDKGGARGWQTSSAPKEPLLPPSLLAHKPPPCAFV